MLFGDPYRFAILVEFVPAWSCNSFKNGLFHFLIKGGMYPNEISTSTLNVDIPGILDDQSPLVRFPENKEIFNLPTKKAFENLFELTYPEPTEENEYPEQIFDYCINVSNLTDASVDFFSVSNGESVRIIGGKTHELIYHPENERNVWHKIEQPSIVDIIISKDEITRIIEQLNTYYRSELC